MPSFGVDYHLCCKPTVSIRAWPLGCTIRTIQQAALVNHYQCPAGLPRGQGPLCFMYMASSDYKPAHRCDFHAQWLDDADCYATWATPSGTSGGVYYLPNGSARRSCQGPTTYVGDLQHRGSKVGHSSRHIAIGHLLIENSVSQLVMASHQAQYTIGLSSPHL
jgi:hypothetical protein